MDVSSGEDRASSCMLRSSRVLLTSCPRPPPTPFLPGLVIVPLVGGGDDAPLLASGSAGGEGCLRLRGGVGGGGGGGGGDESDGAFGTARPGLSSCFSRCPSPSMPLRCDRSLRLHRRRGDPDDPSLPPACGLLPPLTRAGSRCVREQFGRAWRWWNRGRFVRGGPTSEEEAADAAGEGSCSAPDVVVRVRRRHMSASGEEGAVAAG